MERNVVIDRNTCTQIVKTGQKREPVDLRQEESKHQSMIKCGHLIGVVWGTNNEGKVMVDVNNRRFYCGSPLQGNADDLPQGTVVAIQQNQATRVWEIIQAECY